MPRRVARLASVGLVELCKAQRRLVRGSDRLARALAGVVWAAGGPEERVALGLALHDALEHPTTRPDAGLFEWEQSWFDRALPPPPARVLVGAAGSGREALALVARGYVVDAFDPAPRAFATLRARLAEEPGRVWPATYQEVARTGLEERYDAVLFGWGSFAYVVEDAERVRLLEAMHRACPDGPLLASFPIKRPRGGMGRAGSLAARWGLGEAMPEGVSLVPSGGFVRALDREDTEALGRRVGRRADWHDAVGFGHVTWVRATAR